ncbi:MULTISPECIES: DUF6233 domain-containing protein [unclassified Streptomyces]|uniref:DUF6233 domain-containing protein n=1 Tax=unclassified Streptomyces TaxID=2593676 RepID=UPI000B86B61E|nr:DUF6233 domain-containing protein [Streptomyces sp. DvalAA-14]MYS23314.1 hypothetical protein [Streptomyces sp. SID4948]
MSDNADPPRVRVTLPGGTQVPGKLIRWRQAPAGQWWAQVVIQIPAGVVVQIADEDYASVPREPAAPQLVFRPLRHDAPDRRALELHVAGCWGATGRLTPTTAEAAAHFVKHGWAVACTTCQPPIAAP